MQVKTLKSLESNDCMNRFSRDIEEIISNEVLFRFFRNSSVLVTGATGLIGSTIVKSLYCANSKYQLGIHIICQIRNQEKAVRVYGELYEKLDFVYDYNQECEFIIHTVSPTTSKFFIEHPVETIKASVESTINVLELAKKNSATVVYLSSMEQYGVPISGDYIMTEDKTGYIDHLNIRSSYSESKRLCECLCVSYAREYNVDVKIARLAQTFGAGASLSDNRMPMQFAKAVVENKDIVLHTEGNSLSNILYLTDAIVGILTILTKGITGQVYNVCNDSETRSVREIAELVATKVADGRINVLVDLQNNMGYAPDVKMYLNSDKLKKLGWRASVDLVDAYKRLVEYIIESVNS